MPAPLLLASHSGFTETLHTNDGTEFTVVRSADVEPIIDHNTRLRNDNPKGMGASREWVHVAEIPVTVVFEWVKRYGVDPTAKGYEDLLKRLLNDPEWRYLRTSEVIV
jgi:hypothetical protein